MMGVKRLLLVEKEVCGGDASSYDDTNAPYYELYAEELVAFFAICFAHCKGTEVVQQKLSRQVRRAAERTGKPVITFHTIDSNPSKNILSTGDHKFTPRLTEPRK
jgi:hypothetical protein